MAKNTCHYVMSIAIEKSEGGWIPPVYCGKPVAYHMIDDGERNMHREYNPFCSEHMSIIASQPVDEE